MAQSQNNSSWFKKYTQLVLTCMAVGVFTSLSVLSVQVIADQDASTDDVPRLLPYKGYLEQNGRPLTASDEWIRFEVLDNSPAEGQELGRVVYTQTIQTNVFSGSFVAMLGPINDGGDKTLQEVLKGSDRLLVQMTMLGEHNADDPASTAGDDVVLTNPKPLTMSISGLWASTAGEFTVRDTLTVENDVFVSGNVTRISDLSTDSIDGTVYLNIPRSINRRAIYNRRRLRIGSTWIDGLSSTQEFSVQSSALSLAGAVTSNEEVEMTHSDSSFCALTDSSNYFYNNLNRDPMSISCDIVERDGYWVLSSFSSTSSLYSAVSLKCSAHCIDWTIRSECDSAQCGGSARDKRFCRSGQCVSACEFDGCFDELNPVIETIDLFNDFEQQVVFQRELKAIPVSGGVSASPGYWSISLHSGSSGRYDFSVRSTGSTGVKLELIKSSEYLNDGTGSSNRMCGDLVESVTAPAGLGSSVIVGDNDYPDACRILKVTALSGSTENVPYTLTVRRY